MSAAYAAAQRVLAHTISVLEAAGRNVPDRTGVVPGALSAWDCEQLTVTVPRPSVPGGAARETTGRPLPMQGPRFAEMRIELIRCTTCSSEEPIPSMEILQEVAAQLLDDATALELGLTPEALGGSPGRPVQIGPLTMAGPDGGYASVFCTVTLPL